MHRPTHLLPTVIACLIGAIAAYCCYLIRTVLYPGPGDFNWALSTARDLLHQRDPYNFAPSPLRIPYPLPVALFGLPVAWLPDTLAAAIFFGSTTGALAYAILRYDTPWRLLTFLSFPFFYALLFAQWSPLVMLAWFVPVLAPLLVLIKPQIALPVALTRFSRSGIMLAVAILLLSLVIYPTWPIRWLAMTCEYTSFIPVLTLPFGPLLLLPILRWKDARARLLVGMALLPFRAVYDLVPLCILPQTKAQMLVWLGLTWIVPLVSLPVAVTIRPSWSIPILFIPLVGYMLWSSSKQTQPSANELPVLKQKSRQRGIRDTGKHVKIV